jgi:acetylornithine/N-succinyldiaminopimelate aminotransferase
VNVEPDIMTLAKPIAGGLPMGAILVTEEISATIQPGDHGSTFGGGPFVASVARHVLERVADDRLLESVRTNGQWLGAALRDLVTSSGRIRDVRGAGFIWGIDVHEPAADVIGRARDEGLLMVGAGDYTLRILPPLVATRVDLEEGVRRLERALG